MAVFDILAVEPAEVLLDDGDAPEGDLVGTFLDAFELHGQDSEGIVGRIADEETKVNEVVRVGQLGNQLKVLGEVGSGVFEGCEKKDMLLVVESMARGLDRVEVDVFYGRGVDLYRGVVVENDGGLKVGVPGLLFIQTHIHWGFRRAPAIETEGRRGSRKGTHVSLREKERGRKRGREGEREGEREG